MRYVSGCDDDKLLFLYFIDSICNNKKFVKKRKTEPKISARIPFKAHKNVCHWYGFCLVWNFVCWFSKLVFHIFWRSKKKKEWKNPNYSSYSKCSQHRNGGSISTHKKPHKSNKKTYKIQIVRLRDFLVTLLFCHLTSFIEIG